MSLTSEFPPSPEQVEAARTPAGGWTRAQLHEWGIDWPPPRGWKKRLETMYEQRRSLEEIDEP